MKKKMWKNPERQRKMRRGGISLVLTAVFLAAVIGINVLAGLLPEKVRKLDVSDNDLYSITDTSKKILKDLDKEVKLTILANKKNTDERIKTFVENYKDLSGKLSVEWVDPKLHPETLEEYDAAEDTIIVSCADTGKTVQILFTDIIQQSYTYTGQMTESAFDAEGQFTSAVASVVSDTTKKIYRTTGHGEATVSTTVSEMLEKSNFAMEELNLMMNARIPDDCDMIFIDSPGTDITADEKTILEEYLNSGGNVMIMMGDGEKALPNLEEILSTYGLNMAEGYIADMSRCYQGNYYYLIPNLSATGEMAKGLQSETALIVNTRGMTAGTPKRDTITLTPFLETSENAYAVTEEEQKQGTYVLGAVATEPIEQKQDGSEEERKEARLTVFSSNHMIDSTVTDTFSSLDNLTLFVNAVTSGFDDVENVSVEAKNLGVTFNAISHTGMIGMLVIFGIPIVVILVGFVVWIKRRKS